jgi:hypothetical protein
MLKVAQPNPIPTGKHKADEKRKGLIPPISPSCPSSASCLPVGIPESHRSS